MKALRIACVVLLAALAGCGQKSISGMYMEQDSQSIGRLQITQSGNGDILGTLSGVSLKPDGTLDPLDLNLSGTTDGKSITFVVKSNASSMVMNVSATLDHGSVVMSMPGSNTPVVFAPVDEAAYQDAYKKMQSKSESAQQIAGLRAQIERQDQKVVALTQEINSFIQKSNEPTNEAAIKQNFQQMLADAEQHLTREEKWLTGGSSDPINVAQAKAEQGQLDAAVDQAQNYYNEVNSFINQVRSYAINLDQAIATSPCFSKAQPAPDMGVCRDQDTAIQEYKVAREKVVSLMDQRALSVQAAYQEITAQKAHGHAILL